MTSSPITSEVDYDAQGKQTGYLRVPHSTHRSAYGWIGVPICVIANGDGPTLLCLAGVHGDEYEGQIALGNLVRDLEPGEIRGRLIIVTTANAPAAEAGRRVSPIDDGNLNRLFPGDPQGTPTEVIAHYIEHVLLPKADVMVDLHSGGSSLVYPATLLRGMGHDAAEAERLQGLQAAMDLPFAWVFTGGGGPNSTARTALGAANRNGVTGIMAELGGAGAVDPEILGLTERGLRRVLHHLGMLPGYEPDERRGTRALHACGSVFTHDAGIYEPFTDIADSVLEGDTLGRVHRPDVPWSRPIEIVSPYSGIVLAKRALGPVSRGDAVVQIAQDAE